METKIKSNLHFLYTLGCSSNFLNYLGNFFTDFNDDLIPILLG